MGYLLAGERPTVDGAARPLTDEDQARRGVVLGQRSADQHPLGVCGVVEERDLTDTLGLGSAPGDDQSQDEPGVRQDGRGVVG
jgi:hypothetical protein